MFICFICDIWIFQKGIEAAFIFFHQWDTAPGGAPWYPSTFSGGGTVRRWVVICVGCFNLDDVQTVLIKSYQCEFEWIRFFHVFPAHFSIIEFWDTTNNATRVQEINSWLTAGGGWLPACSYPMKGIVTTTGNPWLSLHLDIPFNESVSLPVILANLIYPLIKTTQLNR